MKEKSGKYFDIRDFVKLKRPRLMKILAMLDEVLSIVLEWRIRKRNSLGLRAKTIRFFFFVSCLMGKALQHILIICIDENTDNIFLEEKEITLIDNDEN